MPDFNLDAVIQFRELITETQDENKKVLNVAEMIMKHPEMFEEFKKLFPEEALRDIDLLDTFMKVLTTVRMNHMIINKLMTVIDTSDAVRNVIDIRLSQVL